MWRKLGSTVLVLGSILGTVAKPTSGKADSAPLTVSVFNDAELPGEVLSQARARAESVMADSGLVLKWLDCGTPSHWVTNIGCGDLVFPLHLSVRLVKDGSHRSADVFGESFLDEQGQGNYASVYLAPLVSSPAARILYEGDLLGYVIAHELGHLLLGLNSHAGAGLMHGVWELADLQEAARGRL